MRVAMTALRYLWAAGLNCLFSSIALSEYRLPALTSMQGTMIEQQWVGNPPRPPTNGAEERGKIWTRDDMTRIELFGEPNSILIQRSDAMYLYTADHKRGSKRACPLAAD